jgi:hypothetical protein
MIDYLKHALELTQDPAVLALELAWLIFRMEMLARSFRSHRRRIVKRVRKLELARHLVRAEAR